MYHVTLKQFRDSILEHGLRSKEYPSLWNPIRKSENWKHQQPAGNYGYEFILSAVSYAGTLCLVNIIQKPSEADI